MLPVCPKNKKKRERICHWCWADHWSLELTSGSTIRDNSWLIQGQYGVPGMKPVAVKWKESTTLTVLFFQLLKVPIFDSLSLKLKMRMTFPEGGMLMCIKV